MTRTVRARGLFALLAAVLALAVVPHRVCARHAERHLERRPGAVLPLAAQVAAWVEAAPAASTFGTGSRRFDAEWRFGTFMMAATGFGQLASVQDGPDRTESLRRMEASLDAMLAKDVRAFDAEAHGEDPLESLERSGPGHGHLAYLAYAGLPLALHASLVPSSRFAPRARAVAAALAARFERDALVETYPGEVYPPDMSMAAATMALEARARGVDPPRALARAVATIRASIHPESGLLVQALVPGGPGIVPRDAPRASGTALAAFALLHADTRLSHELWSALRREQMRSVLGFGAMLEYPVSHAGRGDVDSGPVVLGLGVSATGFALAASRAHHDDEAFTRLYATAMLFGAPFEEGGRRTHVTGGPIGDAILFAMLTAPTGGAR